MQVGSVTEAFLPAFAGLTDIRRHPTLFNKHAIYIHIIYHNMERFNVSLTFRPFLFQAFAYQKIFWIYSQHEISHEPMFLRISKIKT